jgi:hypothetical protein
MKDLFDVYSFRARILPGAVVVLPVTLLAVVLVTSKPAWWSALISILSASGVTYLGAQIVRSFGQRVEPELWTSWGGAPTTQLLRFRDAPNKAIVERRHRLLRALFPDEHVPTESEEAGSGVTADASYETVVRALIARTRDKSRFDRIFDENCQYGYRRNLYGCKVVGIILSAASLLITIAFISVHLAGWHRVNVWSTIAVGLIDILLLVVLRWVVTPAWVREAATSYAARLLEAAETL